jgi:hypothetical protein
MIRYPGRNAANPIMPTIAPDTNQQVNVRRALVGGVGARGPGQVAVLACGVLRSCTPRGAEPVEGHPSMRAQLGLPQARRLSCGYRRRRRSRRDATIVLTPPLQNRPPSP